MTGSIIVINVDIRETRVALVEGGVIAELQIERAAHRGTVGNIVLGKVTRVLPGMQAAFIDVGMERAAFLHVEDLIRPDDFEAYLSGDYGEIDKTDSGKDVGGAGRDEENDSASAHSSPRASDEEDDDDLDGESGEARDDLDDDEEDDDEEFDSDADAD